MFKGSKSKQQKRSHNFIHSDFNRQLSNKVDNRHKDCIQFRELEFQLISSAKSKVISINYSTYLLVLC